MFDANSLQGQCCLIRYFAALIVPLVDSDGHDLDLTLCDRCQQYVS